MSVFRLEQVLSPRSVALIGTSPRPGSVGRAILRNIQKAHFEGDIGVVNPHYPDVDGFSTVRAISELSFVPDIIIITAPAKAILEIVREAGELGVLGAVIISAGLGHGAGSLAESVERTARKYKMRLIGPNCLGMLLPSVNLNASFAAHMPQSGHLALISQSGAIATGMVDWAKQKDLGFSGVISVGDQIDADIADFLDYFALDKATKTILLYIEAVKDARKFMSAARVAARIKPVIVIKAGRLAQGAKAAATHTGALAGADAVYDAAFRRAGLLRVLDLRELFDCAETLGRVAEPAGKRLAILTNGGGIGVLAVDRLVELGGIPAALSDDVKAQLNAVLPPAWSGSNPIDIVGDADASRYVKSLEVLLGDPGCDAILAVNVQTAIASARDIAGEVIRVIRDDRNKRGAAAKPVLAVWVGDDEAIARSFSDAAIPNYGTEDDAICGFMHLVRHREIISELSEAPPAAPGEFVSGDATARRIVQSALAGGRSWLDPIEISDLFKAYQIPLVPTFAAKDADEAVALSAPFFAQGLCVVLKILSKDIVHKSDVGGVALNLHDVDSVRAAVAKLIAQVSERRPDAKIEGVIVQPMIVRQKAHELIAGIADDPTFGSVVVFGQGGVGVEVINDKALALPPLDLRLARDVISRTRVSRLLAGYRSVPAVKANEIECTLVKLAQMAADLPEIDELDINPLLADADGVLALDARVSLKAPRQRFAGSGNRNFAIRPYPSQWTRSIALKDGKKIAVRPMRPEDESRVRAMLAHVDVDDVRLRFLASVKEFTHEFLARLTQLDYARAMAFVAVDEAGDIVGIVRLHSDSVYETGEYAILIRSDMKRKGLGWALMNLIVDYAKSEGLKQICGEVLQANTAMLNMCRGLGFRLEADEEDRTICRVALSLTKGDGQK